jgi:hypothetical protein
MKARPRGNHRNLDRQLMCRVSVNKAGRAEKHDCGKCDCHSSGNRGRHNWREVSRDVKRDGTIWIYEQCSGCQQVKSHTA